MTSVLGLPPAPRRVALLALTLAALALALASPHVASDVSAFGEGTETRRIADKLQCPVCHGQSVAESNSQVAEGMRATIKAMLDSGRGENEIVDFFVARYGPGVLREPPRNGLYSAVWWVPGVALLIGAGIVFSAVRQRRRSRSAVRVVGAPARATRAPRGRDPDEPYRERLRLELESGGE